MSKDRFMFFRNIRDVINSAETPEEKMQVFDAICDYAFDGIEPSDKWLKMVVQSLKPTLDYKGVGAPKGNKNAQKTIKTITDNKNNYEQLKQIQTIKQETETETETEARNKKQENNLNISFGKPQDIFVKNEAFDITKINEVLGKYNLAEIKKLTDERKTKLKKRCSDVGGFDEFLLQMDLALRESTFLRGDNKQGWKADFDFFLQKSSWQKAIEGGYRDNKPPERTLAEKQREEQLMDEMINRVWKDD